MKSLIPALIRTWTLRRALLPLLALVPCLSGFGFGIAGPRAATSNSTIRHDPLAFHQYMVNLGPAPARRNHSATFGFTNVSRRPMELRELKTSCGCISQQLEQRVFESGEPGRFNLTIQAANQSPGRKEYTCQVIYGPPDDESIAFSANLIFRVDLPKQSVTLVPRALIVHQYGKDRTTHTINVRDTRLRQLQVINAHVTPPMASVTLLSADELTAADNAEGIVQKLAVSIDDVSPGTHECIITIETDDLAYGTLRLPMRIYGPKNDAEELPQFISDTDTITNP